MFDFPDNPADGDTVTHTNGKIYEYDSATSSWVVQTVSLASLTARVAALEAAAVVNSLILE